MFVNTELSVLVDEARDNPCLSFPHSIVEALIDQKGLSILLSYRSHLPAVYESRRIHQLPQFIGKFSHFLAHVGVNCVEYRVE